MTNPLGLREGMGDLSFAEKEAFDYCIDKIKAKKPSLDTSEAIDEGIDIGMFFLGSEGELHVNKDYFNGKNN
jgi:hypothetical protein